MKTLDSRFLRAFRALGINSKKEGLLLAVLLFGGTFPVAFAQNETTIGSEQLKETDKGIVSAIAPYNEDVRENILIVSQYPQILAKLGQIHDQASQAFQASIRDFNQKKQGWFYNVSRYPKLMHALATLQEGKSRKETDALVTAPDNELKEAAWKLYDHHKKDLIVVDNLNQQAERSFEDLIEGLDSKSQDAFYKLLDMPDVLSLLNDHIDLTVRLGDSFKQDPEGVRQSLANEHDSLEALNKQELAQYKDDLSQNPQAVEDLRKASEQYAKENGYSYPAPASDTVVNYYGYNPYSYWFGYPYWYGSAMWYPGSLWNSTGFYFGLGGSPVIFGLPSLAFSNWFFGGAYRYYPHLYRQYDHYYHNNISQHRIVAANNSGFMGVARRHFNPEYTGRSAWISTPNVARDGARNAGSRVVTVAPRQNSFNRNNAATYHGQSWGGYSRGGFSGGMSSRGGFGGGMRGGRR
ncbi:hypothetical protein DYBT9275_05808 [Dyadobacter sp. CECT 9275]|uniref:DUF3300 domain-containing protein n=1 Tax=Dyadobacter helix TaxID=2822344 RepID=A0A916N7M5_9BACT|nr:hypothetical protein [Dyadobacter sp. CECT 9275]CAG5017604.1 hypothetical protein DYBT9275_05808 [Dyadobacter sp. CECT 9275]